MKIKTMPISMAHKKELKAKLKVSILSVVQRETSKFKLLLVQIENNFVKISVVFK